MSRPYRITKTFAPSREGDVELELVIANPPGSGRFPAMIFNHGSTGRGLNEAVFRRTISPAVIAGYFAQRGWMTIFPQRRGRGKSGGVYSEGLAPEGGYSCHTAIALAGFERAVEDIDDVMDYLPALAGVDMTRLAIGGVSRGGILAIAFAGMRPGLFKAAVNFNGGWLGQACPGYEALNPQLFRRGATAGVSTLWLHGSNDPYYSIAHCVKNHAQFLEAGGLGQFVALRAGHGLMFKPALWSAHMDKYLDAQFPF
ncbi:alpha/beta hydrolase family protein [Pseudogemmobacter bohemicus]|uniref:alpha/beta hydrolase family protein n=1 Tax=Pseudogemmobacter bohemicus TaxID=2250708 RepID=UPI000DD453B3|nr:prolyl oligopeptidase family serine peptidase [Pseudogemmobacter bohemicus]